MLFVGTHHKTGTVLFWKVFEDVCETLGLRFFYGREADVPEGTDIWFMEHSRITDPSRVTRGIHVVRHPYSVIRSGQRYHQICSEKWAIDVTAKTAADGLSYSFDGMTYQQKLRSLGEVEGLRLEMHGRAFNTILDMYRWDYDDPRFLNVRLEEVEADFDGRLGAMFAWLGLPVDLCLEVARKHDLTRMDDGVKAAIAHVTAESRAGDDACLPADLSAEFGATFPGDVLSRLGYGPAGS